MWNYINVELMDKGPAMMTGNHNKTKSIKNHIRIRQEMKITTRQT